MNQAPDKRWQANCIDGTQDSISQKGKSTVSKSVESTKTAANVLLEQDKRMPDYDLDKLYQTETVSRPFIHSKDEDFAMWIENPFWCDEVKYPVFLRSSREWEIIWNMVRFPIIDPEQIISRQDFVRRMHDSEHLKEISEIKNKAYWLSDWVEALFSLINVDDRPLPLIEAYIRGLVPYSAISRYFELIEMWHENQIALMNSLDSFESSSLKAISSQLKAWYAKVSEIKEDYILSPAAKNITIRIREYFDLFVKAALLIEMAVITKRDWLTFAEYREWDPVSWKDWWYIVEPKESWIANDSAEDNSLTLLTWSNMSWKSSILKTNFFMQCMAQSFWAVPCKDWNFHIHDSFFYIDRSSTDHEHDLSAFWDGIRTLVKWIETFGKKPFWCYDEIFSETGPEDQFRLAAATIIYMKKLWAKIFCASHNEKFIELCDHLESVWTYHLSVAHSKWKLEWLYKLKPWADDSYAIEVARTLWLNEEILKIAENYLRGVHEEISLEAKKKQCSRMKEPDQEYLTSPKNKSIRPCLLDYLIRAKAWDDNFMRIWSDDRDFQDNLFKGSSIFTWIRDRTPDRFWWMQMIWNTMLSKWILQMLLNSPMITPYSFEKRKELFADIREKVDFEKAKKAWNQLKLYLYFLWFINNSGYTRHHDESVMDNLHKFNKFILPCECQPSEVRNKQLITFLELNKEILKGWFNLEFELESARELQEAYTKIKDKLHNDPMWMPDEETISELVNRRHGWYHNKIEDFDGKCKVEYELLKEALRHLNITIPLEELTFNMLKEAYKVISAEAERCTTDHKWSTIFSYAFSLLNYMNIKSGQLMAKEIGFQQEIDSLRNRMEILIPEELNYFKWDYDLNTVNNYLHYFYNHITAKAESLESKSIFEIDVREYEDKIHELLWAIIEGYRNGDYKYEEDWPPKLVASVILLWFSQKKNPVDAFMEDFDKLESSWGKFISSDFKRNLKSDLREALRNDFGKHAWKAFSSIEEFDIYEVFKLRFDAVARELFFDFKNFNNLIGEFYSKFGRNGSVLLSDLDFMLANPEVTAKNIDILKKTLWKFLHGNEYRYEREWWEDNLISDYHNPELGSKLLSIRDEMMKMINVASELESKFEVFGWYGRRFWNDWDPKTNLKELMNWNFRKFRDILSFRINHFIESRRVHAPIKDFLTLSFYSKLSKDHNYWDFCLNGSWDIRIEEMFNIFSNPAKQVRNTDEFSGWEKWKILTWTNMSGKTFNLKALAMSAATGKTTWMTTWKQWEMPDIDNVVYMDRVVSKKDKKLSSYWNEIVILNQIIALVDEWRDILFVVDELLSTTSPKYQAAIVYAIIVYILRKQNYVALASHNHEVVDILCNKYSQILKAYHNKVEFDADWKIKFDFNLQDWHAPSNAIHVAEKMWMPAEIIEIARNLI
ncbi:MAG: hypothetical protein ACD_2C00011G0003 [uncultured bacterium (gcode 4)]|uniref:DNA mismatch repair proteins mutS family domain-containing protein n=1 Tax=uncultured bacterium (gcode 4) TaxID=1234023 RepID=K2G7F4_9BACT|nr:MAG: hypothetical protein ACD_2C00011G0003 [uncultured bacterium (gcode 4)]